MVLVFGLWGGAEKARNHASKKVHNSWSYCRIESSPLVPPPAPLTAVVLIRTWYQVLILVRGTGG